MDQGLLIFLSSGLFLGYSLGANDAANVFGTAVGTRMVRFKTAAIICSIFVILGAVISGAGASHTLGKLGAIPSMAGAFSVAFTAGAVVFLMTAKRLPVSTSQAIVGAIIGWNLFSQNPTSIKVFSTIASTWILCPILSAVIAIILCKFVGWFLSKLKLGLFQQDYYTRIALIVAGAFGSYSLGANNIANVMGVFVPSIQWDDLFILGLTFTPTMQLFFIGGLAISAGVFYSKKIMIYVGENLANITPVLAWVIVMAHSVTLFLFSSQGLHDFLVSYGLPALPLVPVSSSQAIIGGVVGVGLYKKLQVDYLGLARISAGWVLTPILSALTCFVLLFIVQNVFGQIVT